MLWLLDAATAWSSRRLPSPRQKTVSTTASQACRGGAALHVSMRPLRHFVVIVIVPSIEGARRLWPRVKKTHQESVISAGFSRFAAGNGDERAIRVVWRMISGDAARSDGVMTIRRRRVRCSNENEHDCWLTAGDEITLSNSTSYFSVFNILSSLFYFWHSAIWTMRGRKKK